MQNERDDHTLQATALVHEAYIRLVDLGIRFRGKTGRIFSQWRRA
jgi:ECF sigma factor